MLMTPSNEPVSKKNLSGKEVTLDVYVIKPIQKNKCTDLKKVSHKINF